jgi:Tol biopolymer transport system component
MKFALPTQFLVAVGATVCVSLAVVAGVPGASGTFPGRNGNIVVTDYNRFYLISPDGAALREFRTPYSFHGDPAWSPDGKRIAFTAGDFDYAGLAIINADGSGLRQFIKGIKHNTFNTCCLSWSPDGSKLAYIQDQGNDGTTAYVMDPKRSKINSWGPVGMKVFHSSTQDVTDVEWLSRTELIVTADYGDNYYAVRASGTGKRSIRLPWREGEPSPDRTMVAYTRWKKDGVYSDHYTKGAQSDLFVANSDSLHAKRLVGAVDGFSPAVWSPDGKRILYLQWRDRALWVVSVDGRAKRRVAPSESDFTAFDWQPLP